MNELPAPIVPLEHTLDGTLGVEILEVTDDVVRGPHAGRGPHPPALRDRPRRRDAGAGRVARLAGDGARRVRRRQDRDGPGDQRELHAADHRGPRERGRTASGAGGGPPGTGRSRSPTTTAACAPCCARRSRSGTRRRLRPAGSAGGAAHVGTSGWAYTEWRGSLLSRRPAAGAASSSFYGETLGRLRGERDLLPAFSPQSTLERWAGRGARCVPVHGQGAPAAHLPPQARAGRRELQAFTKEFVASLAAARREARLPADPGAGVRRARRRGPRRGCSTCFPTDLPFRLRVPARRPGGRPEVAAALAARGGTVCVREEEGVAPAALPPGPLAYVRLKGVHYDDEASRGAARRCFERRGATQRDVYVFARHKDVPADDPAHGPWPGPRGSSLGARLAPNRS